LQEKKFAFSFKNLMTVKVHGLIWGVPFNFQLFIRIHQLLAETSTANITYILNFHALKFFFVKTFIHNFHFLIILKRFYWNETYSKRF